MKDRVLLISVLFLLTLSVFVLKSIAPSLFPLHFVYLFLAILAYWFFSQVGFEIVSIFSSYFYLISIFLLVLTIIIGTVTRNTVRWIPIGPINIQSAEIVRPFLFVFFANYLSRAKVTLPRFFKAFGLFILPVFLIFIQPSLGVSILTTIGFLGILLSTDFNKKYIIVGLVFAVLLAPFVWKLMAPYQRERILTFIEPSKNPLTSGYNSLQSTIAAGSGKFWGLGLGHGTQTQLSFLPEKQTDFIFSATAEELGFFGAGLMLVVTYIVLSRLIVYMENSVNSAARAYLAGFFLTFLVQVFVHVGMNIGMLPITGIPYPLVSAGGSSLLSTMMGLGIATSTVKR